jgi:hypothetical protein
MSGQPGKDSQREAREEGALSFYINITTSILFLLSTYKRKKMIFSQFAINNN